jgi:hypothetical protein
LGGRGVLGWVVDCATRPHKSRRCCIIITENSVVNITHLEKTYIATTGVVFFR